LAAGEALVEHRYPEALEFLREHGPDAVAVLHVLAVDAALDDGRLVAALEQDAQPRAASEEPAAIARALAHAAAPPRDCREVERATAARELAEWLANDRAVRACALDAAASPARRRLLHRVAETVLAAPRHRLVETVAAAGRLRAALARPLPLGLERELAALVEERSDDWLQRAAALIASAPLHAVPEPHHEPRATAIILLGGGAKLD
jgi:hypothetical protein